MDTTDENIFKVIHKTEGKAKNKQGKVVIETSVKGLFYRTEVYIDSHLVDAKEVNCQDLANAEDRDVIFKERYLLAHEKFEELYFAPRVFVKVLSSEGNYVEDEELTCSVVTSVYDNIVRHEVFVGADEIDIIEDIVDKELSANKTAFSNKYKQLHKAVVDKYIKTYKFPANTFLNPILKKYPLYKVNPLYSLYLFLASIVFILWLLSLIVCGKAIKKIVVKVAGKEAGLVVKDLQKSMCIKGGKDEDELKLTNKLDKKDIEAIAAKYVILPQEIKFKTTKEVKSIFIKNNMQTDIIVRLRNRLITDFKNPLVTPEMIVNVFAPTVIDIKGGDVGVIEFKIEDQFLNDSSLKGKSFDGHLVFDIIDVKNKKSEPVAVSFHFSAASTDGK